MFAHIRGWTVSLHSGLKGKSTLKSQLSYAYQGWQSVCEGCGRSFKLRHFCPSRAAVGEYRGQRHWKDQISGSGRVEETPRPLLIRKCTSR